MSKKKKKEKTPKKAKKSCAKKKKMCDKVCAREKAYGEPQPVKPMRPVREYYNLETGEIYPKVFFKNSWWNRIKKFLGLVP